MENRVIQHRLPRQLRLDSFIKKHVYFLYFIFVFFPFLSVFDLGTDMQPNALIVSLVIFLFSKIKLSPAQFYIALLFFLSTLVFAVSGSSFISLRSFYNYASLFFVAYVACHVLKKERLNFEVFLKFSIIIWLIVGLVQTLYDRTFLTFVLSASRTTEYRGVTGLAPEPSFYGVVLIFFLLFLLHTNYKHKVYYMIICVAGIVLLAQSAMALILLLVMLFFYLLTHLTIKRIFMSFFFVLMTGFLIDEFMMNTRLFFLANKIFESPRLLLLADASVNDRFFHIFFSLKGLFDNFMFPNGFVGWNSYASSQLVKYSDLVMVEWFSLGGRIMSGYGAAFFEIGFFALLLPLALSTLLFTLYKSNLKKFFFFFLSINLIMFSAIPIGFSLFAFYLGFLGYLVSKKRVCDSYAG